MLMTVYGMPRVGYDLAVLPLPENIPSWETEATVRAHQTLLDGQYLHAPGGLDNYYGQADAWLQTQDMLRGSNRAYEAPKFPLPVPRRMAVTYDDNGSWVARLLDTDPRIQEPKLAPLPDAPPAGPVFGGTHPDEVMAKLTEMDGKLDNLRSLIISRA